MRELNTYFALWKEDTREEIDAVLERTLEVLPIMSTLETLIENPDEWEIPNEILRRSRSYKSKVQERIKIFNEMKSLQLKKLNRATYNLLLDVSPMVDQESNVLQHFLTSELVSLGLWGNVMAKNMRVKGTNFESLGFGFELPQSLMGTVGAVRVMRVEYDHYSKMCKSNRIPPRAKKDLPTYIAQLEDRICDLSEKMVEKRQELRRQLAEQRAIQRAKEEEERERQRLQKLERKSKTKAGVNAAVGALKMFKSIEEEDPQDKDAASAQAKAAAEETDAAQAAGLAKERDAQSQVKEILQERIDLYKIDIDESELNLRRNTILGGVFYFDMLQIPPQPKKVGHWIICQLETPQSLKSIPWTADYKPPAPPDENTVTKKTPEEIEREIKLQEMELQKLVLVHLKLPSSSLWFEPPTIVRWEPNKQYWSTEGFFDTKFDEGKQMLSFRTINFGIFALSAFRFSNLPLQSWELRPEGENKCVIGLSAAAVQAEFEIGQGTVTLVKFSSGNKPPVKGLQDKPMKLKDLIKEMRRQGVDIFPDYDSHCYIEGLPLKDIQTEQHLYHCMALTANSLNFTWSRWNLLSGYDKLIMQYREKLPGAPDVTHQVMLITPESTCVLECTEASQTFSDKPLEGSKTYADLYTLALDICPEEVHTQMSKAKAVFVNSTYEFLSCTKVLSYA